MQFLNMHRWNYLEKLITTKSQYIESADILCHFVLLANMFKTQTVNIQKKKLSHKREIMGVTKDQL